MHQHGGGEAAEARQAAFLGKDRRGDGALRRARVRMAATSDPASGSVTATAVISSPATTLRIHLSSCALLPAWARCGDAMSVCTSTVAEKPPKPDRPHSSARIAEAMAPCAEPPYSSG